MSEDVKFAIKGVIFKVSDKWKCTCGTEHKFGIYAAAHWSEHLTHNCDCGIERTFNSGRVTRSITRKSKPHGT
jgi:hypothetical protein